MPAALRDLAVWKRLQGVWQSAKMSSESEWLRRIEPVVTFITAEGI
jgi:hypothetical protein